MATTNIDALMTPNAWAAYDDVARGGKFEFRKPLPGFRIDAVHDDGRISDYRADGTRRGLCLAEYRTGLMPMRLGKAVRQVAQRTKQPAIDHCENCGCGYRMVRNPWELVRYYGYVEIHRTLTPKAQRSDLYGANPFFKPVALVLTRVQGYGTAEQTFDEKDPHGTIRVSRTRLIEVWLPGEYAGAPVPAGLDQRIQDTYDVVVHRFDGDLLDFEGTADVPKPDDWASYLDPIREELADAKLGIDRYGYPKTTKEQTNG